MMTFLVILNYAKKFLLNPITLCILAGVALFFAGYITKGKMMAKEELKQEVKYITETVVKYEKVHARYRNINLDTKSDLESVLSYQVSPNLTTDLTDIPASEVKP